MRIILIAATIALTVAVLPMNVGAARASDQQRDDVEDPMNDTLWQVCAYPNPGGGCGDWKFYHYGGVDGLVDGRVVWTGKWTSLGHYAIRFDFTYQGVKASEWVRFSDPGNSGHATELSGYGSADMDSPDRKGQLVP